MNRHMGEKKERLKAIRERIKGFPTGPGLYFMKGTKEEVLYIGKAKNLRSRAASYFQPASDTAETRGPKIAEMLNKVETIDYNLCQMGKELNQGYPWVMFIPISPLRSIPGY